MRRALMLLVMVAGCHPSTSIENTMPVANLQTYRSVALRVHTNAFAAQGRAMMLEQALTQRLRQSCGFESVGPAGSAADVVMDANITNMGRGGGGLISNPNVATIEVLLVLTDGQSKELLGTSKIRGRSSTVLVNNAVPENEAIQAVAQAIAGMLAKSGCSGPRVAKAEPVQPTQPTPPVPDGNNAVPDESHRADAEAANDDGKEKLYAADVPAALVSFEKAVSLYPDPRYEFNVCLAYSAQEQWKQATDSCKKARGMNPQPALAAKIDDRLAQLAKAK